MDPYDEIKEKLDVKMVKRCPSCKSLSLTSDMETRKIRCSKCGFEESFPG